jgi:hypothetical protein
MRLKDFTTSKPASTSDHELRDQDPIVNLRNPLDIPRDCQHTTKDALVCHKVPTIYPHLA